MKRELACRLSRLRAQLKTVSGLRPGGFFVQYDHAAGLPDQIAPYAAVEDLLRGRHDKIEAFLAEMAGNLPIFEAMQAAGELDWESTMFSPLDTMAAYTMIRRLSPARILEIGSGASTKVLARAMADSGGGRVTCIDPAPRQSIRDLGVEHHAQMLRADDATMLDDFGARDVLFIDSSHIMLPGMDVDIEFNRMFPRLPPGSFVHIHDIFLPDDYPPEWRMRHYSEQNALIGWLVSGYFEIAYAGYYAITRHSKSIERLFNGFRPVQRDGTAGSLWLQRRAEPI